MPPAAVNGPMYPSSPLTTVQVLIDDKLPCYRNKRESFARGNPRGWDAPDNSQRSAVRCASSSRVSTKLHCESLAQPIAVDVINDESLSRSSRSSSGPGFPRRDPGCSYCRCGYRAQCGFCPGYRCHSAPSSVRVSVTREGNQQEGRPYVIHPGFSSRHGIRKHGRERCLLLVDRSS